MLPIPLDGARRLSAWHRAGGGGPEPLAAALITALAEAARRRLG